MASISQLFLLLAIIATSSSNLVSSTTSNSNPVCPFPYLYHFGDGATDVGNSVLIQPWGRSLPPMRAPYGRTYPGTPNGRWSDGLVDFDFAAFDFGFPEVVPSLSEKANSSNGVIFSVARSPVMDHGFFSRRGIRIPPYAVSLDTQLGWFRTHLRSVCGSSSECVANRLANSLVLLGDLEANDIGYALTQGRTIEEAYSYIGPITRQQIKTTRDLINMGARLIVIPGSAPLGCFPYTLTAMPSNDPTAYDRLGCLSSVNRLITMKNNYLRQAINNLGQEFPNVTLIYGAFDEGFLQVLDRLNQEGHSNTALKACCGIGGEYNYSSNRFCGTAGVPACSNPQHHMFWDGIHFTQEIAVRIEQSLIQPTLAALNCTALPTAFS